MSGTIVTEPTKLGESIASLAAERINERGVIQYGASKSMYAARILSEHGLMEIGKNHREQTLIAVTETGRLFLEAVGKEIRAAKEETKRAKESKSGLEARARRAEERVKELESSAATQPDRGEQAGENGD